MIIRDLLMVPPYCIVKYIKAASFRGHELSDQSTTRLNNAQGPTDVPNSLYGWGYDLSLPLIHGPLARFLCVLPLPCA
jgi:hypothetical protein